MKLTGKEAQRIPLGGVLRASATKYGDALFVTQAETGEQLTYVQFNKCVNQIAHGLTEIGIARGDNVGIMLGSSIQFLASSYALKKLGAIEVSMNTHFRGVALSRMLNLTSCKTLITSRAFLQPLANVQADLMALSTMILLDGLEEAQTLFPEKTVLSFDEIIADNPSEPKVTMRDDETAVILFTSGTTGTSKGCAIPHRSSVRAAESMIEAFKLTSADAVYTPYPQFHVGASQYDILPAMMVGGRVILRDGFSLSNFWQDVTNYRATWFMCLGSVQQLLWSAKPDTKETQHALYVGYPLTR